MPEVAEGIDKDTSIAVDPESSLGTKEHVDAALKKATEGTNTSGTPTTLLAGKFKSRDDLLKSFTAIADKVTQGNDEALVGFYKTLEGKLGGNKSVETPTPPPDPNAAPADSGKKSSEPSQDQAGQPKTVDLSPFAQEYAETGGLSDDSYTKLAKAGFSRPVVDTYLEGVRANAESLFNLVGGKDSYVEMLQWSAGNIPPADQEAFDKAVMQGTKAEREAAVKAAWKRYTDAVGNHPKKTITPNEGGHANTVGGAFRSRAELLEAMKDPRYGKDPAYERELLARLRISKI